ncbi:MAG: DegT/DnrJ/EryC1/StrS family aminotransferase [Gammaproteobacteria bacterium]|nr:DegT/DnrJ/EryC1/StrS family aminotransferase [Gammaproteobacteria bacterium]MDE2250919.1 DegT/DnrJ/EryC1/StrS family aminotransferase [Gammaproteobacteria bacterium]
MDFIDLKTQYRALRGEINARIQAVLDHGQYILGPEVREFEQRLAAYVNSAHCISVASGTDALLIALMALGIGPGDEVITSPFTFVATAEVIALVGARPVFVDVEADTANMNAALLDAAITGRTRAIMPVSLYGQPADMDEISAIAARRGNIVVIEDAAQSFGATYQGRRSGALSGLGCTSFFPSKPLGCYGDGGAIFTDDAALAQACSEIRVHGQSARYLHTRIGIGGRMDTLQCAILLAKLGRFDWEVARRIELGQRYAEAIRASGARAELLSVRPDRSCVWAQYTVLVENRDAVQEKMRQAGVPTAVHYPRPLHQQPAYAGLCDPKPMPVSEMLAGRVLSLPMSADLSDSQLELVAAVLARATA